MKIFTNDTFPKNLNFRKINNDDSFNNKLKIFQFNDKISKKAFVSSP